MAKTVTLEKSPLTLEGRSLESGKRAPGFTAVNTELELTTLESYGTTLKLISFFPSIDHPICDLQIREMNRRVSTIDDSVSVIGISRDIPFALKRFRETFDIRNIDLISDYRYGSFGLNYGVLIKELKLLTRGTLILDSGNVLRYMQIVRELTHQPDFDDIFKNVENVLNTPAIAGARDAAALQCIPCEGSVEPLSDEVAAMMLQDVPEWGLTENGKISRSFRFRNFKEAKSFLDILSSVAEEQGHHPSFDLSFNRLEVVLTTHAAKGLTENDFIMARLIDRVMV
jgi:thiol peroxidase